MAFPQVMAELEALGNPRAAEMWRRRGAGDNLYGVALDDLRRLAADLGRDHDLALRLWSSRIVDAQLLAVWVVDPGRLSADELDSWVREASFELLADLLVRHVVVASPHARALVTRWIAHRDAMVQRCGFAALGQLAEDDPAMDERQLEDKLRAIEGHVRHVTDRAKDAMGSALVTIARRNERLNELVLQVARRLGPIDVEAGDAGHTPEELRALLDAVAPGRAAD